MNSVVVFLFLSFCCFHGRRQGPDDVLFRFLVRCWRGNRTSHEAVVSCNPFTPIEFVFYLTDHFFSPPLLLSAGPKKYVRFVACSILLTQRNTCITGGPFWFFFFFFCLLVFSLPPSLKLFPTLPRITCLFSHVFFFFFPSFFALCVFRLFRRRRRRRRLHRWKEKEWNDRSGLVSQSVVGFAHPTATTTKTLSMHGD
ncbi:hypothetical protein BKA81DRAFT_226820 [Phyllosticta paracitricarpa]|uniref:Uncharacterized protein n=1 Tax=Phyllosticta paracitricarpa TaxID=2016321 RepID=A0ABR1NFX4_9PEZI